MRRLFIVFALFACTTVRDPSQVAKAPRTGNPLTGVKLGADYSSSARATAESWRATRPGDAALMDKIANRPQAEWLGEWSGDIQSFVRRRVSVYDDGGAMALFVVYDVPNRDCGQHSKGGAGSEGAYLSWISELAEGIGDRPATLILEPDAVALTSKCGSEADSAARFALLSKAIKILRSHPKTIVYLDAGHARWLPPAEIAKRLILAGIDDANGFSLNVSNYVSNEENLVYGRAVSALVSNAHFVIDTSRNGNGPAEGDHWCNPDGRALGVPPTVATGQPLCDAYLWIKRPGESDGTCNGGPPAGQWWSDYALGLAQRAKW